MAHQKAPVSDGYQVVQQIASFAANAGWTVHRNEQRPADTTYWIVTLSHGTGAYITLMGNQNTVYVTGHRGFDASKDWNAQPDQYVITDTSTNQRETYTRVRLRVNPILSVDMFGGESPTPYIYVAIEKEPGYYRHICFGYLQKFGTALGGLFWDITETSENLPYSSYLNYLRIPCVYNNQGTFHNFSKGGVDTQTDTGVPAWAMFGQGAAYIPAGNWANEVYSVMMGSPIQFNGRTPLMPLLVQVSINGYVPFGVPPNMRLIDMTFYEAGDEITIGTDVWKVFPAIRKNGETNTYNDTSPSSEGSSIYGIAYLKV